MECPEMKFAADRPYADIDAAVRRLLDLANAIETDASKRIPIGVLNKRFLHAGASVTEYKATVTAAIERGLLTMHPSGGYVSFTQAGADLFA
jgi:hypothetical protein